MDETTARQAFEEAIRHHEPEFGTFFLARLLDLDISYRHEKCIIRFPVHDFLFNPQGSLHGGILATVMDISMGHLIHHELGHGGSTIEMKTQYLRAVSSGIATCSAKFNKRGKSISFLEARLEDASGDLAACATSTWKCDIRDVSTTGSR